jgi:nitroreductase
LSFETQGYATCAINWPDHEPFESKMRAELSLDDDERVVMLISFGRPDPAGLVPFSAKRPLSQLRIYQDEN